MDDQWLLEMVTSFVSTVSEGIIAVILTHEGP